MTFNIAYVYGKYICSIFFFLPFDFPNLICKVFPNISKVNIINSKLINKVPMHLILRIIFNAFLTPIFNWTKSFK